MSTQDDVQQLVQMSADIRRARRPKNKPAPNHATDLDIHVHRRRPHPHSPAYRPAHFGHHDDRYVEKEVVVERNRLVPGGFY